MRLRSLGHELKESSYFQYEAGTVWAPDVGVLVGLSEIHGIPFRELVTLVLANRKNTEMDSWRDLLRHSADQRSVDVSTSARRIAELESELAALKTRWGDVQDVARALVRVALSDEGAATRSGAAARRSLHRKTAR
jgi:hypothetical protein